MSSGGSIQDMVRAIWAALGGGLPASLGQKAKTASLPVTLASDEDLLGRLGEVQASPTANTVLDRLKALLTGITLAGITLPATLYHGQKTVTTHGTEVALAASQALTSGVHVKALHGNTNMIYVGLNGVTSGTGYVLDAGEEVFLEVANLATVYIDSDTDGEGVSYIGS